MAAENFDKALARVLVYEGGKVDDKRDPGGRTAYGITQRTFNAYLLSVAKVVRDVWTITKDEIRAVYRRFYWDRIQGDKLPAGVDLVCFDAAVNSGVGQAAKWAQRALGADYKGAINGDFGPLTVRALSSANDNDALCVGIDARRLATLKTLKTWKTYGKGWAARVANLTKIATAWASGSIGPDPVRVSDLGGHMKADPADVRRPFVSMPSAITTTSLGATGTAATQLASTFDGFKDVLPYVGAVAAVLTLLGAVALTVAHLTKDAGLKAQDGAAEVEIDTDADATCVPVPVNDNFPVPKRSRPPRPSRRDACARP